MKILHVLLLLVVLNKEAYAQGENPFTKIDYDSIVIYDFEGGGEGADESTIINKKTPNLN